MKNQVLSIEQMQRLKDWGVDIQPTGTCLMYTSDSSDKYYLKYGESTCEDDVVSFTLQDIIELLPKTIHTEGGFFHLTIMRTCLFYYFVYEDNKRILNKEFDDDIIQSAYEMLIFVAENGYLKTK